MFQPFAGFVRAAACEARASGFKLRPGQIPGRLQRAMRIAARAGSTSMLQHLAMEACHYLYSHRVLYVQTALAERLVRSKITLELQELHNPYPLFEICFDEDFELEPGVPCPSALVMICPPDALRRQYIDTVTNAIGPVDHSLDTILSNTMAVRFRDPGPGAPGDQPTVHCAFNVDDHRGSLVDDIINNLGKWSDPLTLPLTAAEQKIQIAVLRLVLGTIAYLNTDQPDVREYKDPNRFKGHIAPAGLLLGRSFSRLPPHVHLRDPHWRFLRHERFKRAEGGGVRCIWVRQATVGASDPALPKPRIVEVEEKSEGAAPSGV